MILQRRNSRIHRTHHIDNPPILSPSLALYILFVKIFYNLFFYYFLLASQVTGFPPEGDTHVQVTFGPQLIGNPGAVPVKADPSPQNWEIGLRVVSAFSYFLALSQHFAAHLHAFAQFLQTSLQSVLLETDFSPSLHFIQRQERVFPWHALLKIVPSGNLLGSVSLHAPTLSAPPIVS